MVEATADAVTILRDAGLTESQIQLVVDLSGKSSRKKFGVGAPKKVDDVELIRLHSLGLNNVEIGDRLGVSRERIRQLLVRYGLRTNFGVIADDKVREAVEAIRSGEGIGETAASLGVSSDTLRRRVELSGFDLEALKAEGKRNSWNGRTFGDWTVIDGSYHGHGNHRGVHCVCSCGTERRVSVSNLLHGISRGCGCKTSKGSRQRIPWECTQTGERLPNTAALARRLGVNVLTLVGKKNRGVPHVDSDGNQWTALHDLAVPHVPGRSS